jgi:hypothetical protein
VVALAVDQDDEVVGVPDREGTSSPSCSAWLRSAASWEPVVLMQAELTELIETSTLLVDGECPLALGRVPRRLEVLRQRVAFPGRAAATWPGQSRR